MAAAVRGGNASRPRTLLMRRVQIVSGRRNMERPRVRWTRIVVTKFSPPMVNETMNRAMETIQSVCPSPDPGTACLTAERGG